MDIIKLGYDREFAVDRKFDLNILRTIKQVTKKDLDCIKMQLEELKGDHDE